MLNLGVIGGRRGLALSELISILDHLVRISAVADISDRILQVGVASIMVGIIIGSRG